MEFALLGWPADGPVLRLDYRRFSYAGKFAMSTTGKAAVRAEDPLDPPGAGEDLPPPDAGSVDDRALAAAAFNEDRTDPGALWIRYLTVARGRRGEGLGPRLAAFVAARARERGYRRLRVAVNNPFAYHALYKAGFGYTGRETGLAELVLERPGRRDRGTYQCGLDAFRERAGGDPEASFLARREGRPPPETVAAPGDTGAPAGSGSPPPDTGG